ncbi:MAG: 16S rRNA (cytidine(1402)-2'-O)-methyltransferase [Deltaproteobacteria bacterium]|nr:16S rRNA (cytidine(1402)-2'-O)-methyltransferase [Deltaproteobacteria bacterium]
MVITDSGQQAPTLYVIATPIGNLADFSQRALETLKSVDLIAAEDTRHTGKLLEQSGVRYKKLISYHDHNEEQRAQSLVKEMLEKSLQVGLVSDAGTPCISDPGFRLVSLAHQKKIRVVPVPGACAMAALVSASGLPSDRLLFTGFLPAKKKALEDEILSWKSVRASIVFYESARRIQTSTELICRHFPEGHLAFGREISKLFEEIQVIHTQEAGLWLKQHENLRGEFVVMLSAAHDQNGKQANPEQLKELVLSLCLRHPDLSQKDLLEKIQSSGVTARKTALYQILLEVRKEISEKDQKL